MQTTIYNLTIIHYDAGGNLITYAGPYLFSTREGVQKIIDQTKTVNPYSKFLVTEEVKSSVTKLITEEFVC